MRPPNRINLLSFSKQEIIWHFFRKIPPKLNEKYTERLEKLKKFIRFGGLPIVGQGDLGYLLFHPEITFSLVI